MKKQGSRGPVYKIGRDRSPKAPLEYREAVAAYARSHGGSGGDVVWVSDPVNTWQVRLNLKTGDPRLQDHSSDLFEAVLLHQWVHPEKEPLNPLRERCKRHPRTNRLMPSYVALLLPELGVGGLITILEKGSLMTGRGEFKSAEHAMQVVLAKKYEDQNKLVQEKRQDVGDRSKDLRRMLFKIPFIPVGIELSPTQPKEGTL